MMFSDAIQNLTNGRAAKPGAWGGYVARVDRPAAFSADSTYAVGDLVTYDGAVYRCSAAVSAGGSWSGASNWVKLYDLLPEFSAESAYSAGDRVLRDSAPYECVSAVSAGAWDSSKWARLPDVPHALVFQERSDEDADSATVYVAACMVSASGRSYGAFAPALSVDPQLLYALVWDSSWTVGNRADYEVARSGTSRW